MSLIEAVSMLATQQATVRKTERFFEQHGPKAVVLARFVPIIRTFAPFVAGVAHMRYRDFAW